MKTRIAGSLVPAVLVLLVLVSTTAAAVSDVDSADPAAAAAAANANATTAIANAAITNATIADREATRPPTTTTTMVAAEGRGHMKNMKKLMLNPYMLIPQLITLGFAPFVLANLKMMVMSALMMNNMALNAAIFMTIRNMVFGPRPQVKYVNHGYHKKPHGQHQTGGGHQGAHQNAHHNAHHDGHYDQHGHYDDQHGYYGDQYEHYDDHHGHYDDHHGHYDDQHGHYDDPHGHYDGHYDHYDKNDGSDRSEKITDEKPDVLQKQQQPLSQQPLSQQPLSPPPLSLPSFSPDSSSWDDTESTIRRKRAGIVIS